MMTRSRSGRVISAMVVAAAVAGFLPIEPAAAVDEPVAPVDEQVVVVDGDVPGTGAEQVGPVAPVPDVGPAAAVDEPVAPVDEQVVVVNGDVPGTGAEQEGPVAPVPDDGGPVGPAGGISGTVTADADGEPIARVCVSAQTVAGGDAGEVVYTDASGRYLLGDLAAGSYRVGFNLCGTSSHQAEFYDNASVPSAAEQVEVVADQVTVEIDAALADDVATLAEASRGQAPATREQNVSIELVGTGNITGTVTADTGGAPLGSICVSAYEGSGGGYDETDSNGDYDIGGLPAGSYRVWFSDCHNTGSYIQEYFDNTSNPLAATLVSVTDAATTADIDAGLAAGGHITGTVTADDGGGALVNICVEAQFGSRYGYAETDSNGDYDIGPLPAGSYRVEFSDCNGTGDYLREYFDNTSSRDAATLVPVTAGAVTPDIDAGLAAPGHITGTVTADDGGGALENICVAAQFNNGSGYGTDETDTNGDYDIGGLPAGSYRVQFWDCYGTGYREYFNNTISYDAATLVAVTAGTVTPDIDAGMPGTDGHITGTVTADGGGPLDQICVYAEQNTGDGYGNDRTDSNGDYDIGGLPAGSYRVQFSDCNGTGYVREYFDDAAGAGAATLVAVHGGMTTADIDAGLAVGGHITGTVTADGGGPLENICVSAQENNGYGSGLDRTDSNGFYDIDGLPAGSYRVWFSDCNNTGYAPEYFDDAAGSGAATLVAVTLGVTTADIDAGLAVGGHITGTVTADGGGPLENICVSADENNGESNGFDQTDSNGLYDIGGLPEGGYRVRFWDCNNTGYAPEYFDDAASLRAATLVAVTAGATTPDIDAGLAVGGHITGTVTADGGGPLENICVYAQENNGERDGSDQTDSNGFYDIGGLPAGAYRVEFSDCNNTGDYAGEFFDDTLDAAAAAPVAVTPGATTPDIDAGLAAGGHITGTVTADDGGLPVAHICVEATASGSDIAGYGYTESDGSYDIGGLPAGSYTVAFADCGELGGYAAEYFDDTVDAAAAAAVPVTGGATTTDIDASLAADGDGDGVAALIEDGAPNGGDGNNDGTADSVQSNVASLRAEGGAGAYVTVVAPAGTRLRDLSTIGSASLPTLPAGVAGFPAGLVGFTLDGIDDGATVAVEVIFHGGVGGATRYYKLQDGVWVDFTAHAVFNGNTVALTLTDGGLGDADGTPNGEIVDPGGPAVLTGVGPPPLPPPPPGSVCAGRAVTVDLAHGQSPTSGPDVIRGTPTTDVINALGGDDTICGLGGDDTINGGQGRDRIFAGAGNDAVRTGNSGGLVGGGDGDDTIRGGIGDDALRGRGGDDSLFGRAGNDALHGGTGTDDCDGGTGTDSAAACETVSRVP